jgi:hypothetical protein
MKYLAHALAAAFILLYVVLALLRISYPYELEWQEGSMVDHVQRVLDGLPLYTAPSVDWVPAIYPPLYYYVSAGVSLLTGVGFLPLRLVSLLASLGCMAILYFFVRRETKDKWAGLFAAGLFAAVYRLSGAWFDLARVDSLFLLFLLLGLWFLRFHRSGTGWVLAALFTATAVFTKQTGALAAIFLAVYALLRRREGGWFFILPLIILLVGPFLLFNWASDGWFSVYVLQVPAGHALIGHAFAEFWLHDILRPLMVAVLFGLAYLGLGTRESKQENLRFYLLTGAGFVIASWVPRVKDGNYANDLLPAYAFIALLFGLAVPRMREWGRELRAALSESHWLPARAAAWASVLFWAAIVAQFAALYYRPLEQIPTAADRAAGEMLIANVRKMPGEVWIAHHGYLGTLAGKRTYASALPIYDVLRSKNESAKDLLLDCVASAFKSRRFSAIITDNDRFVQLNEYREYEPKSAVFPDPQVFWPVSGVPTRPLRVYVPRAASE